eukprot:m.29992 g.29992  ORF g.29992 m.29992 type:complete len:172 (+) comp8159_c0_seq1:150-665(+)
MMLGRVAYSITITLLVAIQVHSQCGELFVAIPCPANLTNIANCSSAAFGEFCEGDEECGGGDINNCDGLNVFQKEVEVNTASRQATLYAWFFFAVVFLGLVSITAYKKRHRNMMIEQAQAQQPQPEVAELTSTRRITAYPSTTSGGFTDAPPPYAPPPRYTSIQRNASISI